MFKRKGQSTLEYALIIAVVVAGLLLMQHYVKRGFSGRLKKASDDIGGQYDPEDYTANFTISDTSKVKKTVTDRKTRTEHVTNQVSSKTGTETVAGWGEDETLFGD